MTNEHPKRDNADEMSRELDSALRILGLGMPRTVEEVAAAEKELEKERITLPCSLLDSQAVLTRRPSRVLPIRPHQNEGDDAARQNLARAAREGGDIPPEIEERMRRDRKKAEGDRDPR